MIDGLIVFGKGIVVVFVVVYFGFYLFDSGVLYWFVVFVSVCYGIVVEDIDVFVKLIDDLYIMFCEGCV